MRPSNIQVQTIKCRQQRQLNNIHFISSFETCSQFNQQTWSSESFCFSFLLGYKHNTHTSHATFAASARAVLLQYAIRVKSENYVHAEKHIQRRRKSHIETTTTTTKTFNLWKMQKYIDFSYQKW